MELEKQRNSFHLTNKVPRPGELRWTKPGLPVREFAKRNNNSIFVTQPQKRGTRNTVVNAPGNLELVNFYSPTDKEYGMDPDLEQHNKKRLLSAQQNQQEMLKTRNKVATPPGDLLSVNDLHPTGKRYGIDSELFDPLNDDDSSVDLIELQNYIERLQAKANRLGVTKKDQTSFRYQTLHRTLQIDEDCVPQQTMSLPFLDPPENIRGQGKGLILKCKLPLKNFALYL